MSKTKQTTIQLGDKVKCRVTGFAGVVTSCTEYLNGCRRIGVTPAYDKKANPDKYPETWHVDEHDLIITKVDALGLRKQPKAAKHEKGGQASNSLSKVSRHG